MRGGRGRRVLGVTLAVVLFAGCGAADPGVRATSADTSIVGEPVHLALDRTVSTGVLDNGLTWFVRRNEVPGSSVELRLVVNAGSALEDEDQSGVAHFLEHMMFNGTEKYAKNEIVDVLQRGGSSFGADVNAYTSYDETVYQLNVSNTDDEIETGLDILHEWLTAVSLDPGQVESERGVVLGEYRDRELSADGRVFAEMSETLLAGTPYEGRAPIGTRDAIEAMTPELLRRFWDDWYRPDNVAVVVTGDIPVADMEARIEEIFGDAVARSDAPERPVLEWPMPDQPLATVVTDDDLLGGWVELALVAPAEQPEPDDALSGQLLDAVLMGVIADRLSGDVNDDAPFNDAQVSSGAFVRAVDAPSIFLSANPDDVPAATAALLDEFARVQQFGLHEQEVAQAVSEVRSGVDAAYAQRDSQQASSDADGLADHFLTGAAFPSASALHQAATSVLDSIDADVLAERFSERLADGHLMLAVATRADVDGVPTEAELVEQMVSLADRDVDDRADTVARGEQLMEAPEPAEITARPRVPERPDVYIDPTAVRFENGVMVILNPNDIAADYVELYGVSPGGFSVTDPADAPAVWLMNEVNTQSGLGELDQGEVDAILGATTVDVTPYPSASVELFRGSTSSGDLELALQAVHQYVTASNFDEGALQRAVDRNLGYVADPDADPQLAAQIALNEARYGDDPRFRVVLTADDLAPITTDQLERVWDERFGNAADWVYVLSGDFDLDDGLDLAARYLGTLPSTGEHEETADVAAPVPAGVVTREVRAGSGENAELIVQYTATSDGSAEERIQADVLAELLTNRLTERIREDLGASYSPAAYVSVDTGPPAEVVTVIDVTGSPDDIARLATVVQEELASLRTDGPTQPEMDKATAVVKEQYNLIDNAEIVATLARWLDDENAIDDYADQWTKVETVTKEEMRRLAARVLEADQYIQVTQLPR